MDKEELAQANEYYRYFDFDITQTPFYDVKVGDVAALPEFTVPKTVVNGKYELVIEEQNIQDYAIIYKITQNHIHFVFEHGVFYSAIDRNEQTQWEKTQLYHYLTSSFKKAMNDAGIKADTIDLLCEKELYGENALPYFRYVKNRVTADIKDDECQYCWLNTLNSENIFAAVSPVGECSCGDFFNSCLVRPVFSLEY